VNSVCGEAGKRHIQSSDIIGALFPSHSKTKKEKRTERGIMYSVNFERYT